MTYDDEAFCLWCLGPCGADAIEDGGAVFCSKVCHEAFLMDIGVGAEEIPMEPR